MCASSVKTDNAYKILKDIFSQVVAHSGDQTFRLKLKGFGVLKINDGYPGYIEFVNFKEDEANQKQLQELNLGDDYQSKAIKAKQLEHV